jgi:hypothetical protein
MYKSSPVEGLLFYQAYAILELSNDKTNMSDPEQSIFAPKTERQPLTFEQAYADGLGDDADLEEMVMKSEGVKPPVIGDEVYVRRGNGTIEKGWKFIEGKSETGRLMTSRPIEGEPGKFEDKPVDATDLTVQGQYALQLEFEAQQAANEARVEIENLQFVNPAMPLRHSSEATPSYTPPISVDQMPPIAPAPRTDGFREGVHRGKIQVVDPHTPVSKAKFWST